MSERFMCDRPMCGHPMTERLVCNRPMRDHPMCERPDTRQTDMQSDRHRHKENKTDKQTDSKVRKDYQRGR